MRKFSKRVLAVTLSSAMVFSLAACNKTDSNGTTTTVGNDSSTTETTSTSGSNEETTTGAPVDEVGGFELSEDGWGTDYDTNTVYTGSVTTQLGSSDGGEVSYDVYKGVEGKDYTDEKVYTLNQYTAGTTNMKWSTHTWETADDNAMLTYITRGFYNFVLNDTLDGWAVACEMASELPVDVTADFVGQYGISAGETGKAWKIALNPDACWEDGTPIDADTYIYSYKELMDPLMANRRADSLYSGDYVIYGAKNYFYQGKTAYNNIPGTVADYLSAGGSEDDLYIDVYTFYNAEGYTDADGNEVPQYVSITDDTVYGESANDPFSGSELYTTYFAAGADYEAQASNYVATQTAYDADYSWDNVGVVKTGDYELTFIYTAPIADPNYYVPYALTSIYLVYEPLWESCKTYYNSEGSQVSADSADIASITTNYCTTADTTMSFGPYKLSYFELDKQYTLTRNDNWYGYKDGKHLGQFQADNISVQVIGEHATALMAFENGELDEISLVAADMAKYGASDYIRYTPQSYTTKISFNTSVEKTSERGTQLMTNAYFRKAFSLAIDRTKFAQSMTAAGSAGYGLLNHLYVYDPFTGASYRDTDGAKNALVHLYGLTYGEDGDYDTLDEAYEAITGYDLDLARANMAKAYDECIEKGLYDGTSNVEIEFLMYASDDTYVQMFNFLKDALESACVGTGFEGKVTLKMTVDPDYYETNYSGGADMIFTTWGGAAYSPWTMLYQSYGDAADGSGNQMEYGFDTTKITVNMDIDGVTYTGNLQDWSLYVMSDTDTTIKAADGTELTAFSDFDSATKAEIFGRLEYAYLSFYATMPMYYRNVGSLVSQKGDFAVTQYVDLVGFGDVDFYTFNYDDEEWETVKSTLTY